MDLREITLNVPSDGPGRQAEIVWYGATIEDAYAYGLRLLDDVASSRALLGQEAVLWLPDGMTSVVGKVVASGNDYDDDLVDTESCWLVVREDEVRGDKHAPSEGEPDENQF